MKRRLVILTAVCLTCMTVTGEVYVNIKLTSGERIIYKASEVDSLSMIEPVPRYVTDIEGTEYPVGLIGQRYWMLENLRVTRYDTLSHLRDLELKTSSDSTYTPYMIKLAEGDVLYNWSAANGITSTEDAMSVKTAAIGTVQGICPNKFHLPALHELHQVASAYGNTGSVELRSETGWAQTPEQVSKSGNNASGFNAIPAGYSKGDERREVSRSATFWSSDAISSFSAYSIQMNYTGALSNSSENKMLGRSVRCVWDGQTDRDWLYVYKPDDVIRYRVDEIEEITTSDDTDSGNASVKDTEQNTYKVKRYGTTYWMQEYLKTRSGLPSYSRQTEDYTPYIIRGAGCDALQTNITYYSISAAMGMTKAEAEAFYEGGHLNSVKEHVKGPCPSGWRLPMKADVERLWSADDGTADISGVMPSQYYDKTVFAYGLESSFWVSDVISGYRMLDGVKKHFVWNIPYVDNFRDEYRGRHSFLDIYNSLAALPCRCVKDLTEPLMECRVTGSSDTNTMGIWENNYPVIKFTKNDSDENVMTAGTAAGRFDSIRFIEK